MMRILTFWVTVSPVYVTEPGGRPFRFIIPFRNSNICVSRKIISYLKLLSDKDFQNNKAKEGKNKSWKNKIPEHPISNKEFPTSIEFDFPCPIPRFVIGYSSQFQN